MRDVATVAIIGAGELGGAIANMLARADIVDAVRLIDEEGGVAAGQALDIMQAAAIHGFATHVTGSNDPYTAGGASVVVIADHASAGQRTEWQGDEALALLTRLSHVAAGGVVVCAGALQRDVVERGCCESTFNRSRLFGSAPESLAASLRAMVALEAQGSAQDVSLTVLGIPPDQVVVPWADASIAGVALTRTLDTTTMRRLASRLAPLWPPGPYALAAAAVKTIDSVLGNSRQLVSCFVAPETGNGRKARAVALPARLGRWGIVTADPPALDAHDQVALDNAMLL
jgi:malate dehydrogenase